jgi:O-antigen/teichoic acid export membrane protein
MNFKSDIIRNSSTLLSGNATGQAVTFAAYPVLTRLYSREEFGAFNFYVSIVGILVIFATGRYNLAVVLPKSERQASALLQISLLLSLAVSVALVLPALLGSRLLSDVRDMTEVATMLPLLPVFVLVGGWWQSLNYWFTRQKEFGKISFYNISQSVINAGAKCLWGIRGLGASGLIWGTFTGQAAALAISLCKSNLSWREILHFDKAEIRSAAKTYSNFPKFELTNETLVTIAGNIPVLLLSAYFDMVGIGLFSLALTVASCPVMIFSNSMYQILFERISSHVRQGRAITGDLLTFCKICFLTILPFFVLFVFIAEWFFAFVFGAEWREAGMYFRLLLPWQFAVIFTMTVCCVPDVLFRQKKAMKIEILYLAIRIASLYAGIRLNSFVLAITLYSAVSTVMSIIKTIWYFKIAKQHDTLSLN